MANPLSSPSAMEIKKVPLREEATRLIKELILTNQLRPGQSLGIGQLADHFGVSHTPIREALGVLEREGLVRTPPYGKPEVTRIEAKDVREVWDMRLLLEQAAVEPAILGLSDELLDEMESHLYRARRAAMVADYRAHYESDVAFHRAILCCVENELFQDLAHLVEDRSIRIRTLVEATANEGDVVAIIDEHIDVLRALRARDERLARRCLIDHLEAGKKRTLAALEELRRGKD